MQIKTRKIVSVCTFESYTDTSACWPDIMAVLDLRVATAGERMFLPSIRILPSRQTDRPVHG